MRDLMTGTLQREKGVCFASNDLMHDMQYWHGWGVLILWRLVVQLLCTSASGVSQDFLPSPAFPGSPRLKAWANSWSRTFQLAEHIFWNLRGVNPFGRWLGRCHETLGGALHSTQILTNKQTSSLWVEEDFLFFHETLKYNSLKKVPMNFQSVMYLFTLQRKQWFY